MLRQMIRFARPVPASLFSVVLAAGVLAVAAPPAAGQGAGAAELKRDTMIRLQRPVNLDVEGTPLRDVVEYIETVTETDLDPLWIDDRHPVGLDPELPIDVKSANSTALAVIERVLDAVDTAQGGVTDSTWQFTESGGFEFGPKERLARRGGVVVYDLSDLIFEMADPPPAPQFDLQTVFQAGGGQGGGGGGQSPFQLNQQQQQGAGEPLEERMQLVLDVVRTFVEPRGWASAGGTAAQAQIYRSQLIINAPDYVHRAIEGYSWWPRDLQRFGTARTPGGDRSRRWVTKSIDPETGAIRESDPMDVSVRVATPPRD